MHIGGLCYVYTDYQNRHEHFSFPDPMFEDPRKGFASVFNWILVAHTADDALPSTASGTASQAGVKAPIRKEAAHRRFMTAATGEISVKGKLGLVENFSGSFHPPNIFSFSLKKIDCADCLTYFNGISTSMKFSQTLGIQRHRDLPARQ